jgi:cell wall-associated NlpC family hydrolase
MNAELRAAIVAEARTWLRTPYRNLGAIKGVGVDCAMLLVRVYQAVGLVPADFDPRPYSPDWYLHRDEERFLAHVLPRARRLERGERGDIALYRYGRSISHGAILVDDEQLIHANRLTGLVELCERRALAPRFDSFWTVNEWR